MIRSGISRFPGGAEHLLTQFVCNQLHLEFPCGMPTAGQRQMSERNAKLARAPTGIVFNEHTDEDGAVSTTSADTGI
jgi:hypothetical protein